MERFEWRGPNRIRFSLKSLLIFMAGASVALTLSKLGASLNDGGEVRTHLITLALSGATASWGLAFGGLLGCPWRGLAIGFLSAFGSLFGFIAFDGR